MEGAEGIEGVEGVESISGSCLCGAVAYQIQPPFKTFQYCHCSRCRKMTGTGAAPNMFVPPAQFTWVRGEENIRRWEHPDAKYFASVFCKTCGSTLPWLVQGGMNIVLPVGTLDDDPGLRPQQHIFWDSKAVWDSCSHELPTYAEFPKR